MLTATFTFQSQSNGRAGGAGDSPTMTRKACLDDCDLNRLLLWVKEAIVAGLENPKVVRVEIGEVGRPPRFIFGNIVSFLDWQQRQFDRSA